MVYIFVYTPLHDFAKCANNDIGLYFFTSLKLLHFKTGTTFAFFQAARYLYWDNVKLNNFDDCFLYSCAASFNNLGF
jgi:hypothetical protein